MTAVWDIISNIWSNHSAVWLSIGYKILLSIVILAISSLMAKGVRRAVEKSQEKLAMIDSTLTPVVATGMSYLVYVVAGLFILDMFGVNTTSIVALLGAAGLAVGLALRDTLSNIAAGIMLLFLRPFRTGDLIEFGAVSGLVYEINLFTTTLRTYDGLFVYAPNNILWGTHITNFTRNKKRRMDISIGIAYSDSIDRGFEVLYQVAKEEPRLLSSPAPRVIVASLADSSVNLQLRAWANVGDYWKTLWDLNKKTKEAIEQAGLSIPFPQRSVHVMPASPPLASSSLKELDPASQSAALKEQAALDVAEKTEANQDKPLS